MREDKIVTTPLVLICLFVSCFGNYEQIDRILSYLQTFRTIYHNRYFAPGYQSILHRARPDMRCMRHRTVSKLSRKLSNCPVLGRPSVSGYIYPTAEYK